MALKNNMENHRKWNFIKLAEVIRNNRLHPLQKALLVDILLYAGVSGDAFPSQDTLANDLGYTTRSIRYALDMLYAANLVRRKRRGFGKSNIYFINEELYFHNNKEVGSQISSHQGNTNPDQSSTPFPPNETHVNNSSNDLAEANYEITRKRIEDIRKVHSFLNGNGKKTLLRKVRND